VQHGEDDDGNTVFRRSAPNEQDVLVQIVYRPLAGGGFERRVERIKLFRRTKEAAGRIEHRKKLPRFGAAKGAQGAERGVTMVARDLVAIEDPLSEEAGKTGEERMIERLKATVKQKGVHRSQQEAEYDFDSFVQRPSLRNRFQSDRFNNRTSSPARRNTDSPARF